MTTVELKAKTGTLVDSEYISASRQSAALSLEAGLTAACFYCHTPNDGSNSALQPECTKQQVDGPDNLPVKTRSSSRIARKPPAVPAAAAAILPKQLKPAPRQTARKSIKVHRTSQHAVLEGPEAKQTVGTSKVFTKAVASEQIPLAQAVPSISYVNHKTATTEITQAANCLQSGNGQAVTKTDKVPKQQSNKRKRAETVAVEVPQIELGIEYTYKPGKRPEQCSTPTFPFQPSLFIALFRRHNWQRHVEHICEHMGGFAPRLFVYAHTT